MMGDGVAAVVATRNLIENFVATSFRRCAQSLGLLVVFTIVLTSCGGSSSGGGSGSGPAPTATLSASPTTIANAPGQSSTLTVSSTNANSCTVNNGGGQVGCNGSTSVSPTTTTTYTLTATGSGGTATASATVTVGAAPTVTITANPMSVNAGGSTLLTVTASNATLVVITDNLGDPSITLSATGGTATVTPRVTAVYTATATGVNASTASQTVTVTEFPPTVAFSAGSTTTIMAGQSTTLSWTSTNATSLTINNGIGNEFLNGSLSVTPAATTIYTVTATGPGGTATATATVTVNQIISFQGMDATQAEGGTTEDDIDPNGAVGTKQFMEYVNTSYQAYDKTTLAPVWSAPQPINTPWQSGVYPVAQCSGSFIQLDAVIIFDRLALRWVIAAKTTAEDHYYFCIAVSNTDDLSSPSFAWYDYFYSLDPYLTNGTVVYLPDWPKLGTWWNAYYAAMDQVNNTVVDQTEVGIVACAFDRTDMLLGYSQSQNNSPNVKPMLCLNDPDPASRTSNGIYLAHSLIPADVDGTTAPPTGRDEFMVSIENPQEPNNGGPVTSSTINLWDFQLNWTTPSFTLAPGSPTSIQVDSYQPGCYTSGAQYTDTVCAAEPGQPQPIGGLTVDSVGDRLMPRFAYRNFGTYESFLVSHTVQSPANGQAPQDARQTGIRWYELLGNLSGTPEKVHQQGTITPDITNFRFLPSIAQDRMGNVVVGYSVSSPVSNPGINFSFWNLNDPNGPGTTPVEITILSGSTEGEEIPYLFNAIPPAISNQGQWGSYASITVDPFDPSDDCTFWYVNEYWPTTNLAGTPANWATNIANFQIPGCQ
jgi:hypothetical protein